MVCRKKNLNGYSHDIFCKGAKREHQDRHAQTWQILGGPEVTWDMSNADFWHILLEQEIELWLLPLPAK